MSAVLMGILGQIRGPNDITGLERIMLVAQGDLQRHLR